MSFMRNLGFLIIFTPKHWKMLPEIFKIFRNTTSEELAEISKNIKLLQNISNNQISNKFYETHNLLQNLSSLR